VAKKEEEIEVTVISREDVTTFPKIAQPVIIRQVTYVAAGLPPATVQIPKDQWTQEAEKKALKDDIKRRLQQKPESFRV